MNTFKHIYWDISGLASGDITSTYRQNLANAASNVQSSNSDDVLFGLSAGGFGVKDEGPQISLVFDVKRRSPKDFAKVVKGFKAKIETALTTEFSSADPKVTLTAALTESERVYYFDEGQQETAKKYKKSFTLEKARILHAAVAKSFDSGGLVAQLKAVGDTHRHQLAASVKVKTPLVGEGFSVDAAQYAALSEARGNALQTQMDDLQQAFSVVGKENLGASAAVVLATKGVITVGKKMWTAYQTIAASATEALELTPELVLAMISAAGVGTVVGVAAAVIAAIGTATVLLKDSSNLLLVVNGQTEQLSFLVDHLLHGEKRLTVPSFPAAAKSDAKLLAYPCGFYLYQKSRVANKAIGFYGSTTGLCFKSKDTKFTLGLDCPNTVIGGNNSIRVFKYDDAKDSTDATNAKAAAKSTDGTGKSGESITLNSPGKATVYRAGDWGSINYAICLITAK